MTTKKLLEILAENDIDRKDMFYIRECIEKKLDACIDFVENFDEQLMTVSLNWDENDNPIIEIYPAVI